MRQLEESLGVRLLLRNSRGVELTSAGEVFLPHARAALEELKKAESAIESSRSKSEISLGLMHTPGRALVVDLLAKCKESPSGLKLHFRVDVDGELRQLFADEELDAVICYDPAPIKSASVFSLYQQEYFLVGPPRMVNSAGDLDRALLGTFPLVLGSQRSNTRQFIDRAMDAEGINLQVAFEVDQTSLKREFLLRHDCCSIAPYGAFGDDISAGTLCARRIKPALRRTVALAVRHRLPERTRGFLVPLIRSVVQERIRENQLGWRTI